MTINELMKAANNSLCDTDGNYTPAGSAQRPVEDMYKNCIDKINNGSLVVPSNSNNCPPRPTLHRARNIFAAEDSRLYRCSQPGMSDVSYKSYFIAC